MTSGGFQLIVLGAEGGPFEDRATGYLLGMSESRDFLALDAGSMLGGIRRAFENKCLQDFPLFDDVLSPLGAFFHRNVKGYFISHSHLDHFLALALNSQVDVKKTIYGMDFTIDALRDHIFNYKIWPNFGNEGIRPLHLYTYERLKEGAAIPIKGTEMVVEAYSLSHPDDFPSSALLIEAKGAYFLYFGDTSSDFIEKKKRMEVVWKRVAPLIGQKKLKGMVLECSYPAGRPDHLRHGHLDALLFFKELKHLQFIAGTSLEGLSIVVTHRKENLEKGIPSKTLIAEELQGGNDLGVNLIFPEVAERLFF